MSEVTESEWYVYIVRCIDDSLYTGVAVDVAARIASHNSGKGARYTRSRSPVTLVYSEAVADRSIAQQREYAIKQLSRSEKLALIESKGFD
ncbi:MAG: GIY-YIG nuclease family protein [Gammaproteobacteria bacterium]|nr:GIY-YIG nuclease family protein [Gammaproteobacteria bacterium]